MEPIANPSLLERDTELGALAAVVAQAGDGVGGSVFIEGPAGAGKTVLVAAACREAADKGFVVLRAHGGELERDFAFGAVRQLFDGIVTAASPAVRERLLAGAAAPAERVLAEPGLDSDAPPAEAGFAVVHAIYWLAANIAADSPLLIAVDDVHWVDEASLRSLDYLARRVTDLPIAVVLALRPAEPAAPNGLIDALRAQPQAASVMPRALSRQAVAAIVTAEIPDADEALCDSLHAASAGNPLYLRELLRRVATEELQAGDVTGASLPMLADSLMRRVDRVAPDARSLAAAIAVLGEAAPLRLAAAHAGLGLDAAARIAQALVRIDVLTGDDPFEFVHPVLRSSVYTSLTVTERQTAHARAADLLVEAAASPETVAAHVAMAPVEGSEIAVERLRAAARDARARAAPGAAIAHLRRALDEGAPEPERAVLLLELGRAQMAARDPVAIGTLQEAHDLAQVSPLRMEITLALVEVRSSAGQWEAAVALIDSTPLDDAAAPELRCELEACRAVLMASDPHLVDAFDRDHDRLTELSAGDSWPAHAIAAVLGCVKSFRCREPGEAARLIDQALARGRLLTERGGGAWAAAQVLDALISLDEFDRAQEAAAVVEAEGRRTGAILGVITGICYRGWVHGRRGNMAAASADLRTIFDITVESGMQMWLLSTLHAYQDAMVERPELEDVAALTDAIELEPRFARTMAGAMLQETRGRLALERRDRERALSELEACRESYARLGMGPVRSTWRSMLAAALPESEGERARALVAEEIVLARASGSARTIGIVLRAEGLIAGGARGVERLRESVDALIRSDAQLELARSEVELGSALRRLQQRAEAKDWLMRGSERAHRCGAVALSAHAGEELRAAGMRPRRPVQTGADSLTPSELRVARLAAAGLSNREIAQELYVSPKTVDTHLSHAYAKLGLAGQGARRGLPEVLG